MNIVPEKDLFPYLMHVKSPGRYVGGEYGIIIKNNEHLLRSCISFPDLYEIGMSNLAVKILYNRLNSLPGVSCERVFAPDLDFEQLLRKLSIPLYTLETGIPLNDLDILGFSVGYELSATNMLTILELGHIPLHVQERTGHDPIVIAGGPAVTNPVPLQDFIDAFFIGESEHVVTELFASLAVMKKSGASRDDLIHRMLQEPSCYHPRKSEITRASVWKGFGIEKSMNMFPVPNLKPIQDNGIVEIMRGCPNGCRFCHAGIFYRPFRMKPWIEIEREIHSLIHDCGYREITLSSLSSGDYIGIVDLVRRLNTLHASENISFSLPSLRIDSLTFPLLEEISSVRKSGLTFAVETPVDSWQRGLNKTVGFDNLLAILKHARDSGWRQAKFYFMIGLPVSGVHDDTEPIFSFLNEIQHATGMQINANVGTFIPKPHTPFQWSRQLTEQESLEKINSIKYGLRSRNIKLGFNSPFQSFLEGILARGDERVGDLIEKAYKAGARFDSWEDLIRKNIWRDIFSACGWDIESELFSQKSINEKLPWDKIDLGVRRQVLITESEKALSGEMTESCNIPCSHHCGVCKNGLHPEVVKNDTITENALPYVESDPGIVERKRVLFSFSKTGKSIFFSHLNIMNIFERALLRGRIHVSFTEGFNPKPKLEFAQPLSLGFSSEDEIGACYLDNHIEPEQFILSLNSSLPEGISVHAAKVIPAGASRKSLMAVYGGSEFLFENSINSDNSKFFVDLTQKMSDKSTMTRIISSSTDRLHFFLPASTAGGVNGLMKKLLTDVDIFSVGIKVCRKKTFCVTPEGYMNYFDYYLG